MEWEGDQENRRRKLKSHSVTRSFTPSLRVGGADLEVRSAFQKSNAI